MPRLAGRLQSFWSEDKALTVFLLALVLVAFVIGPLGVFGRLGAVVLALSTSFLLIAGVLTVVKGTRAAVSSGLLAFVTIAVDWLTVWYPGLAMRVANCALLALFLALLAAVVGARVFRPGRITWHRIVGAVAVYIMLGIIWSQLYRLVLTLDPAAFRHDEATPLGRQSLVYFSFVTMTTVGFGDITPVHQVARSLATMEALVGQLYPAILIARLVSLELTSRSTQRKPDD